MKRFSKFIQESIELDEKLKASDDMGDWVKDFQKSDAPQFKGKSQKKRQQMAIAAKLDAEREAGMRNEEADQIDELKKSTLASYVKKASADQYFRGKNTQYHDTKAQQADGPFAKETKRKHYAKASDAERKATNRDIGIGRAVDRLTKEEVELDEVSDKKLDAYRQKAFADQPSGDDGSDKYRKRKFGRDLAFAKQTGRAKVLATKEEAELDEISNELKKRYHEKGREDVYNRFTGRGKYEKPKNPENFTKTGRPKKSALNSPESIKYREKIASRNKYLAKVKDQLNKEEVELDEQAMTFQNAEKLKNKHLVAMDHHKKSGNSKGYAAHSIVVRKFEDTYDRHGTGVIPAGRIVTASQKAFKDHPHSGMKESVELDELKRSTLASYVKKAAGVGDRNSLPNAMRDQMTAANIGDKEWYKDSQRKANKRGTGIQRAADRLAKEEVELDEVSTEKLRDYASAALQDKNKAKADKRWKYASKAMKTVGDREAQAAHARKYNKMEEVGLEENIGGLFKNAFEWEKSAKARGLVVKSSTHPSGEATKYQIAKDKQGNNRGHFDHGTRSGRLKE